MTMSAELFTNVKELFTQIDCWVQEQEPGDGTGAQLAVSNKTMPEIYFYVIFDCVMRLTAFFVGILRLQLRLYGGIFVQVSKA